MCEHCESQPSPEFWSVVNVDSQELISPVATTVVEEEETLPELERCADCGSEYPVDDIRELSNGERVCECCEENYITCDACDCLLHNSNSYSPEYGDGNFCVDCFNERFCICENCGVELLTGDAYFPEGFGIRCENCYERHFVTCEECDTVVARGSATEVRGQYYCEDCAPADMSHSEPVPLIGVTGYLTKRCFAVELECFVKYDNAIQRYMEEAGWHNGCDSSLRFCPDGYTEREFTSGPIGGQFGIEMVERASAALRESDTQVNKTCGFHMHIDAQDETPETICKFARLAKRLENWAESVVPPSRRRQLNAGCDDDTFCAALPNSINHASDISSLEHCIYGRTNATSEKREKYSGARYRWINLHSWFYRGTVEIRLHSGTTDSRKILAWVEFWLHAFEYAKSKTFAEIDATTKSGFLLADVMGLRPETIQYFKQRKRALAGDKIDVESDD